MRGKRLLDQKRQMWIPARQTTLDENPREVRKLMIKRPLSSNQNPIETKAKNTRRITWKWLSHAVHRTNQCIRVFKVESCDTNAETEDTMVNVEKEIQNRTEGRKKLVVFEKKADEIRRITVFQWLICVPNLYKKSNQKKEALLKKSEEEKGTKTIEKSQALRNFKKAVCCALDYNNWAI